MIVLREKVCSCTCKSACLLGGSGDMLSPQEFSSSSIVSDAIWDKIVV